MYKKNDDTEVLHKSGRPQATNEKMDRLVCCKSVCICLQTLAGSIKGYNSISCELEIFGLDNEIYYIIFNVFSINEIPVRHNLVPTKRKILELPHLQGITLSIAKVSLLIGVDVPELFCISKFHKEPHGTPSAIFTPFSCSLLRPSLSTSHSMNSKVHFSHKTDDVVYQLIESLFESEFLKGTTVLDTPKSKEDCAALHLMQDSVSIHKGYYQPPLLWKHTKVTLLKN